MPNCSVEIKLVEEALRNTSFNVNGLTHAAVHAAWNANDARFSNDFSGYWQLMATIGPGRRELLKGHMIIGDGGTRGHVRNGWGG